LPLIFEDVAGSRVAFIDSSARTVDSMAAAVSADAFLPRSVFAHSRISSCLRSSKDRDKDGASEAEEPTRGLGTARIRREGESRPGWVARGAHRDGFASEARNEAIVAPSRMPTDAARRRLTGGRSNSSAVTLYVLWTFSSDERKGRFGFQRRRVPGRRRDPVRREARSSSRSDPSVYMSLPRGVLIARPSQHHRLHLQLAQRRSGGIRPRIRNGRGSRSRHGEPIRSSRALRPTRRRHVLHERFRLGCGRTFAGDQMEEGRRSANGTLLVLRSRGSLPIFAARASTSRTCGEVRDARAVRESPGRELDARHARRHAQHRARAERAHRDAPRDVTEMTFP
jgi:hypothetical protein